MLRTKAITIIVIALAIASGAANADSFDYTGVEAGDNIAPPGDGRTYYGWYSAGTYQLPLGLDAFSLSGAYYSASGYGQTQGSTFAGINYHWSAADGADLVADLFYRRDTVTTRTSFDAATGYAADAGFHVQVTEAADINVVFGHQALSESAVNFIQISPSVDIEDHWSLSMAWQHLTDASNQFTLGLHYEF